MDTIEPRCGNTLVAAPRGLRSGWLDLAVGLVALALLWSPTLRSDGTPSGDGSRLMKFISFAHDVGGFAFWNPYRNGGYPLAADPEQFWLLSFIVDPNSPHANLTLNVAIFALILLSAVPAWLIGRTLGLRPLWNVLFVVLLGFNERLVWLQASGRIAAVMFHATLLLVIWNLMFRRLRPWNYVVIGAAIGVAFAVSAHFALVHCALVLSSFLFSDRAVWRQPLTRSLSALGRALLVSLAGFALSGLCSIPVLAHFAESRHIISALAYPPEAPDSALTYFRLLFPFVPADIEYVSFLSLLPLPALLLARWAWPAKIAPGSLGFDLTYLWGALFLVMALPFVGPAVKAFYQILPLVSGVRWFAPFEDILRAVLAVNAFAIFQALERRRVDDLDGATRFLLGAYLAVAAIFAAAHGFSEHEPVTAAAAVVSAIIAAYAIMSGAGLRIAAIERTTVACLGGALAIVSTALIASEVAWKYYPQRPNVPVVYTPTHVTNERNLPRLEAIVRSDPDPYFRFISDASSTLWFLDDEKRGTVAFSLFYPSSLARTLTYLSPRHATDELRPHWVQLVSCGEFDSRALDLIAVKYMFCWLGDGQEPRLSSQWQEVGRERGYVLFRNADYRGGIKVFCDWRAGGPWEREAVLAAFSSGVALVNAAAAAGLVPPSAGCGKERDVAMLEDRPGHMTLKATSTTTGIVFIPDNYDRGWRATINGVASPILEIYGAYLGVPVGAGESVVRLEYRDEYFWGGLAMSVLAAVGLCGYGALAGRRSA